MVNQDVLFADRGKTVAAVIANAFRKPRLKGLEFQFRAICRDQLGQFVQSQKTLDQNDVLRLRVQRLRNEFPEFFRHRRLDFDPDHRSKSALLQRSFELADQVFGLFLHLHVAVTDQSEHALRFKFAPGKQVVEEQHDHAFQGNHPANSFAAGSLWRGQVPEPRDLRR